VEVATAEPPELSVPSGSVENGGAPGGPVPVSQPVSMSQPVSRSVSPGGSGRGLAGLRERVGVLGGEFSAGREGRGFVVRARIPS